MFVNDSMEDLVSIIVPVYNIEEVLNQTVQGILKQSYMNIEIILINDGSTDRSGEICDSYALIDKRVRVVHKENGGVSNARNVGIEIASGKYICFVDGDDVVSIDMVKKLLSVIEDNDLAVCGLEYWNERRAYKTGRTDVINRAKAIKKLTENNKISYSACGKLYRSDLVKQILFDEKTGILEDYLFVCEYLCNCNLVVVLNETLYFYVKRHDSALHRAFSYKRFEMMYSYRKTIECVWKVEPQIQDYIITSYKVELIELLQIIENNEEFETECKDIVAELERLRKRPLKGDFKKKLKIILYYINGNGYFYTIRLFRKLKKLH